MTIRTMARFQRAQTDHTDWCGRNHTCGASEHRGRPITIAPPTGGRAVVTRVRAADRDYAEITLRVPLGHSDHLARGQLTTILTHLRQLLAAVAALRPGTLPSSRQTRPAITSRRAA